MDRFLFSATALALIFEVLVLFADLRWIHIPFLSSSSAKSTANVVGKIEMTRQNVRHRSRNAISWEKSDRNDPLHDFDSVLTLSQSAASLRIEKDIGLKLEENTLVTIEPRVTEKSGGGLRLRLSRGGIHARTKSAGLGIQAQEWTVDANAGSELNVKSLEGGKVDLEILTGEVNIQRDGETHKLEQGSRVSLIGEKVGTIEKIVEELKWPSARNERIYSHEMPVSKTISWEGSADLLRFVGVDGRVREIPLQESQRSIALEFGPGSHHLTLVAKGGVSRSREVQIWQAPVVRYYSPLPRDRVKTGQEIPFTWMPVEGVKEFMLQLARDEEFSALDGEKRVPLPRAETAFGEEGDFAWRVIAVDEEGFEIPAYYVNPIYSVKDPLKAPSLKKPTLRAPAKEPGAPKDGAAVETSKLRGIASLWMRLLEKAARAQKRAPAEDVLAYEIELEWEPVDGASHYVIEISRTADFRTLVLAKETKRPSFVWRDVKMSRYHWRVAAGRGSQRGLFSQASEIDMKAMAAGRENDFGATLRIVRKEIPKPAEPVVEKAAEPLPTTEPIQAQAAATPVPAPVPAPVLQPPPAVISATPELKPAPPPIVRKKNLELWIGAPLVYRTFEGESSYKGSMKGAGALSAELAVEIEKAGRVSVFDVRYERVKWKTDSSNPFQADLAEQSIDLRFVSGEGTRGWKWGLAVRNLSVVSREAPETVKLEEQWVLGPAAAHRSDWNDRCSLTSSFDLHIGSQTYGLGARVRFIRSLSGSLSSGWQAGWDAHAVAEQGSKSSRGLITETGFWLGRRW